MVLWPEDYAIKRNKQTDRQTKPETKIFFSTSVWIDNGAMATEAEEEQVWEDKTSQGLEEPALRSHVQDFTEGQRCHCVLSYISHGLLSVSAEEGEQSHPIHSML